ncbi:hypothetical protein [Streptomyces flaveolus]|uniref:hypothetical protein n=1 Tax=Streptomyces flaveolus TaxID=67297 RepID=UPI00166FC992|nr:hypothetical protein [Streptomyces flaveolus]GGQ76354.1 hypothetical protein GCM10010216_42820 [Streptomyces flaveolus]
MGVFARLFRRSKTTEEASAAETRAETPAPGSTADEKVAEANGPADTGVGETAPAVTDTAEDADSESVGIPKQQSAGEAVDNEADKGART